MKYFQWARAVEYIDCIPVDGQDPLQQVSWYDIK